jgi:uncharacterized membrane protein SirB2
MDFVFYAVVLVVAVLVAIPVIRYALSIDEQINNQEKIIKIMQHQLKKDGMTDEDISTLLEKKPSKNKG